MHRPFRICFVAASGYPVLALDRSIASVGGAEVQQSLIAVELARRGHDVSMISMDFGQTEGDRVRGVRVLKMFSPSDGIPVARFFHPRLTSLWSAMRRADADIYYQRGCGGHTGIVAGFARNLGRHVVFASAADADFDVKLPTIELTRDKILFRYGLRHVDLIITQSERQKNDCNSNFGRKSVVIESGYGYQGLPARHDGPILWVGNLRSVKRPELFLDLVERLPQYKFKLVGGNINSPVNYTGFAKRAAAFKNLEMTGFVPFVDVERQFDGASLIINTSIAEGFPNTFLQAWSRGIPSVAYFDQGAHVNGTSVGNHVTDLESMVECVNELKSNYHLWQEKGENARKYVRSNHSVSSVVNKYEMAFDSIGLSSGK